MADNSQFLLGANDEHGQNPPTAGKRTPVMPFLDRSIYENEFNRPAKNYFIEAGLRNGYRMFDVKPEMQDISISNRVRRVNNAGVSLLVTFAYNAYGSGTTFNSVNGIETYYSVNNSYAQRSRQLAEQIFISLLNGTSQKGNGVGTLDVGMLSSVNCPAALIEAGYMTNLAEAKLMLDWNFQTEVGEEALHGVSNYLGTTYSERDNLGNYPLLRQGDRGNFVMLLQFMLTRYGYNVAVDGVFGPATLAAVRRYQTDNSLAIDGIVGQNTWRNLLFLPPFPTLRRGNRGTYVKFLQSKLLSKLYPLGVADGIFGARTENAVIQFQSENGLTPDGIVGPRTWPLVAAVGGGRT